MDVYVYDSPNGPIADFRPYLDGKDNSFEPARRLGGGDPRWEKIKALKCPRTGGPLFGQLRFTGMGSIPGYHELMVFPVAYSGKTEATAG
jgi:hypothetical protein